MNKGKAWTSTVSASLEPGGKFLTPNGPFPYTLHSLLSVERDTVTLFLTFYPFHSSIELNGLQVYLHSFRHHPNSQYMDQLRSIAHSTVSGATEPSPSERKQSTYMVSDLLALLDQG